MAWPDIQEGLTSCAASLSKSRYLQGLQCSKLLWHVINMPEQVPSPDAGSLAIFDQGREVGRLARLLYLDGILIGSPDHEEALVATVTAMTAIVPIFEGAFQSRAGFARVDILVPVESGHWDVMEVKSSTSAKDVHFDDLAFQAHVLAGAGVKVRKLWLLLIDTAYVRHGEICPRDLFVRMDVTEQVQYRVQPVEQRLLNLLQQVAAPVAPVRSIGAYCNDPFPCPLQDTCWAHLPPRNVTSLYRGAAKGFDFLGQGVVRLADIGDENSLTENQRIQHRVAIQGQPYIDRDRLAAFLRRLMYPLYFMDFETFATAIPLLDGVRPYEQVPFQFSIHVVAQVGASPANHYFLADGIVDPRPAFLAHLRQAIGSIGSVVVYNQAFELGRLRECQVLYPQYTDLVNNIEGRLIDLLEPFRSFAYYHADQEGSCSIKAVLPALVGQNYKALAIQDGGAASREFIRVTFGEVGDADRIKTRAALHAYCGQDTLAMVQIVERLRSLVDPTASDCAGESI